MNSFATQSLSIHSPDVRWQLTQKLGPSDDITFPDGRESVALDAIVPGYVHADLIRHGVIADPFWRLGEWGARWVDDADWIYRAALTLTQEQVAARGPRGRHFLEFETLDTLAKVFVNDRLVGTAQNGFTPHRFDVTFDLKTGENQIRVEFQSARRVGAERALAYLGDGTSERGRATYFNFPPRAFVRKPQYMSGWDWGPELLSCGIAGPAQIKSVPHAEIVDARVHYDWLDEHTVDVFVDVTIEKYDPAPLVVSAAIYAAGDTDDAVRLPDTPGKHTISLVIRSFRPTRWHPNGTGAQRRYFLNVKATKLDPDDDDASEVVSVKGLSIGFKSLELVQEPDPDGVGEGWMFVVNGAPLFMKGANWIPDHSLPGQISEKQLRQRLTQARDAGFNMLRVWGGGLYESETFYSLCDELGLLVWQDFAFACAMYPDDDETFVENVRAEAIAAVKRIRNRVSLALWCGGNENLELFQGRWSGDDQATKFFGDRLIHQVLPRVLSEFDDRTPYWPNSPYGGENCQSENIGDAHYWNVWHSKEPGSDGDWTNYIKCDCRFSSEFGFASPAGLAAWNSALDTSDRTVDSLASRWHDKTRKGYETYLGFVKKHFPDPQRLEDFIYYGQANQAMALQFGVEHWRRRKGRCWGTLFWQLNDCWPTHSWAVIDSAGVPKLAYFAAKRFYAPVLLSLFRVGNAVEAHIVNDTRAPISGELVVRLRDFDGNDVVRKSARIDVAENAASGALLSVEIPSFIADAGADVYVEGVLIGPGGDSLAANTLFLAEPRDLRLPNPGLKAVVDGAAITLSAERFAAFVTASIDGFPAVIPSDSGFHLTPGSEITLTFSDWPAEISGDALLSRLRLRRL